MLKQHKDHYEAYKRALLESSFAFDQFFSGLQKWQVWLSVTFSPIFQFKLETGKVHHVSMFHRRQKRTCFKKI